jgi:hypothetical protein
LDKTGCSLFRAIIGADKVLDDPRHQELEELAKSGFWVLAPTPFSDPLSFRPNEDFGGTFRSLAVLHGLQDYFRARAKPGCLVRKVKSVSISTALDARIPDSILKPV